jgi:structural maintenance of chromosome 4
MNSATELRFGFRSHSKPDAKDTSRIKELDQLIASNRKTLESLQASSKTIEAEIQQLEQKILDIGGSKMLAQKSKVDGILLRINLANDEITRAEVAVTKAGKDIIKLEKSLQTHQSSLAGLEQESSDLDEELNEVVTLVNGIRSRVEEAQHATENAKDDLQEIKGDLDEQQKIIQKFRAKEV